MMLRRNRHFLYGRVLSMWLSCVLVAACTAMVAVPVLGQPNSQGPRDAISVRASDLVTLVTRCGEAAASDESFNVFRDCVFSRRRSEAGEVLAFEENRWFVYAMADMSPKTSVENTAEAKQVARRFRRVFLLKPSTLVVEDVIHGVRPGAAVHWMLRSGGEPKVAAGRFRLTEGDTEIIGQTIYPIDATQEVAVQASDGDRPARSRVVVTSEQPSGNARFVHVFQLGPDSAANASKVPKLTANDENLVLSASGTKGEFRLTLPNERSTAGSIEITAADGTVLSPNRLLPSGVMPHGLEGAKLMERWDAPYRRDQLPGWDVGRSCTHLVKAVEDKTFKPGRAILLGCGSGTNAIYLASKGFEVTGVDVSPTALAIAAKKAAEAGVQVHWMLADVVALPELQPYDLVFDRGCYHHICQYDSPAYVETLRRLSHAGSQALILAGRPADGSRGGPPRIEETTIRGDFSTLFDFQWLQKIHFDSRNPNASSAEAWSIHLQRKDE